MPNDGRCPTCHAPWDDHPGWNKGEPQCPEFSPGGGGTGKKPSNPPQQYRRYYS